MGGSEIWPQNANRITFDPFLATKLSKIGNIPYFARFGHFFAKKGVKYYPI